jgi:hypothetical protein
MTFSTSSPPRKVLLFSGHMIDAPGRAGPRFPPDKAAIAAGAIAATLEALDVGSSDLAICGGACGGDLLFAEAALARGAALEVYIPFEEPEFLEKSVDFADADWHARFDAAKSRGALHVLPLERGTTEEGDDPYERNNLWQLDAAMRFGPEKVDFICLWNGQQGDGPGGTRHLMQEVQRHRGRTHWLDTTKLWT